ESDHRHGKGRKREQQGHMFGGRDARHKRQHNGADDRQCGEDRQRRDSVTARKARVTNRAPVKELRAYERTKPVWILRRAAAACPRRSARPVTAPSTTLISPKTKARVRCMTGRTATASLISLPYTSLRPARVSQLTSASAGACTAIASREYWRQPITMPMMT